MPDKTGLGRKYKVYWVFKIESGFPLLTSVCERHMNDSEITICHHWIWIGLPRGTVKTRTAAVSRFLPHGNVPTNLLLRIVCENKKVPYSGATRFPNVRQYNAANRINFSNLSKPNQLSYLTSSPAFFRMLTPVWEWRRHIHMCDLRYVWGNFWWKTEKLYLHSTHWDTVDDAVQDVRIKAKEQWGEARSNTTMKGYFVERICSKLNQLPCAWCKKVDPLWCVPRQIWIVQFVCTTSFRVPSNQPELRNRFADSCTDNCAHNVGETSSTESGLFVWKNS